MKANSRWTLLTVLCLFGSTLVFAEGASAAMSCRAVHKKQQISWETDLMNTRAPQTGDLDLEKLQKHGFRVENNQLLDKDGTDLGQLRILDAKYLYEWAPKEYHEAWIKTGGIDDAYMKRILEMNGQSWGRGFYVSLHPTDSAHYGNTLTVFPVNRPLVILRNWDFRSIQDNVELLVRLGKAGIDSVSSNGDTWLPIISSQHLQNPKRASDGPFKKMAESENSASISEAMIIYLSSSREIDDQFIKKFFKKDASQIQSYAWTHERFHGLSQMLTADHGNGFLKAVRIFKILGWTPESTITFKEGQVSFSSDRYLKGSMPLREAFQILGPNESTIYAEFTQAFNEAQK